jgi:hypothetical protein
MTLKSSQKMKIKRNKYNSIFVSFVWVGLAFLFLGQTPPNKSTDVEQAVKKWDYQDIMNVSQLIDQITYFKDPNTEFKNRYGGLLAPDNRTIAINQKILSDITLHLEKIREGANKKSVLKALESDFDNLNSLLLPPEYWGQIQEIKANVYHVQNKVQEIDAYSLSALALINSILPYIEELIESDTPITAEKITDVYFKVKSTQATLDLFVSFIENSDEELLSSVIRESDVDFLLDFKKQYDYETYVKKNIEKIIADSDAIKEYQRIKKEYYLEHYENLEDRINNIYSHLKSIHGAIQNELNGFVDLANEKVGEYIQESDLVSNGAINASGEYIDIYPPETSVQSAKYWIRANIPTGTLRSLELQGKEIKNVPVSFSLVYKIEHRNNGRVLNPDSLLGGKIDQNDIANWKFNNLTAEIPLGFSVQNVRLTKMPSELLITQVYSPSIQNERALSFNQVGINLPEDGPWTNYKQLYEQQSEILSKIGVSEALGLEVTRVRISQDSLMPKLTVRVNSSGFLNSLISSKKEFNSFEIDLGNLDQSSDEILNSIKSEVHNQAQQRLNLALNSNKELLKEMLLANSVDFAEVKMNNGILIGTIKFTPKSFKIGDQVFPIPKSELLFQSEFKEGKLNLKVSKPTLQYDAYIKKFLENELQKLQGLEELIPQINKNTVFFNIIQNIQFENFETDTDKKQISTQIHIDGYDKESLPVIINKDGIQAINGVDEFIKGYVTSQLLELVKPQFEEECQSFFSGSEMISVFGEKFELESIPDCNDLNAEFKATLQGYPDNTIKVLLQSNGEITIVSFNAPKVLEKLNSSIKEYLTIDFDYIKFLNPRFQKGKLVFDSHVDIPLLNLNETVGVLTLTHQSNAPPEISFEGATTESLIKDKITSKFVEGLNKFINDGKLLQLEFTDEGDGIQITSVDEGSTDLFQKKIGLQAKITLVDVFEIEPLNINVDIETGKIYIEPITLENSVLANFKQQIEGEIVPGLQASVEVTPMTNPIRLEGDIQINLHGMQFPSMGFIITKDKIEFHPNLSFPIPGALQIVPIGPSSPGLVLTNGNATLDLEKKQLRFGASMTVGEATTAPENSRLINMRSSITSYYEGSRLGDFELQANVILLSVLNVMEGKGTIKTKEGCFKLEASTKGPLRDVFKFDQQVEMNCNPNLFLNIMEIDVIGLKNNLEISAIRNTGNSSIDISGKTNYSLLGAKLGGGIETSLEINNPLSFAKNATANFGGKMQVSKFTLSGVDLGVNYYNASLDFTVLGMELGIGVPNIGDITEGKILEQILSMLDFDPKAVLEILKNPTKIKFKVAPMGVGESVKTSSNGGRNKNNMSPNSTNSKSSTNKTNGSQESTVLNDLNKESEQEGQESKKVKKFYSKSSFNGKNQMIPIKDILNKTNHKPKFTSYFPEALKGALAVRYNSNPPSYTYEFVHKSISDKLENTSLEYAGYAGRLTPSYEGDSVCYTVRNKEYCFSNSSHLNWYFNNDLSAPPNFFWRYAHNPSNGKLYLYLTWPSSIFKYDFHTNYLREEISFDDLKHGTDEVIEINGDFIKLSYIEDNREFVKNNVNNLRFWSNISNDNIFFLQDSEIRNRKGEKINQIENTAFKGGRVFNKKVKDLENKLEKILDSRFAIIQGTEVYISSESNIFFSYRRNSNPIIKEKLNKNLSLMASVWVELDEAVLQSVEISKTSLLKDADLDDRDFRMLNILVNRKIREPQSTPSYDEISVRNRQYQIWNTSTSKPKVNEFINDYGNSFTIDNSDLLMDLKLYDVFSKLTAKLKSDVLAKTTLVNLTNNVINEEYTYVSKKQDSLLFINGDWDFLIQKKDTLVHLKNRIQSNSYNLHSELQDGNRVNKPKFLSDSVANGLHASFIFKVVSIISKDTTTTAKIENENGKLVGYFLSEKDFSVVWETDKNTIESMYIDRTTIKSKILKNRTNAFTGERIISSIDKDFSLDQLVTYFKKGLTKTAFWYDNPDKIQSLIILN